MKFVLQVGIDNIPQYFTGYDKYHIPEFSTDITQAERFDYNNITSEKVMIEYACFTHNIKIEYFRTITFDLNNYAL